MAFGKRAEFNRTATQTLAQAAECAKSAEARDAFLAVAEWAGYDAIATAELRLNVADIMRRQ
jgi:hypothetical protein